MSRGLDHRCCLDLTLRWLWCRRGATAPIGPPPWELPNAASVALKRQKGKKKKASSSYMKPSPLNIHYDQTNNRISFTYISLLYLSHFPCENVFLPLVNNEFFFYSHFLIPIIYLSYNSSTLICTWLLLTVKESTLGWLCALNTSQYERLPEVLFTKQMCSNEQAVKLSSVTWLCFTQT